MEGWSGETGALAEHALRESARTLEAYQTQPNLVREHVGIEENIFSSGYGRRQIFELVQNAADAILDSGESGRIAVVLTKAALYCANEGVPIDQDGVTAILAAYLSQKRGAQIGHFGLGFKSVLNVTSTPQFFCRAGSFGFDGKGSFERISAVVPGVERVPVLRLAHLLDPTKEAETDDDLASLMSWATTVVRLPRNIGDSSWLSEEMASFPAHFLIFSPHVDRVELVDRVKEVERTIEVASEDSIVTVSEGDDRTAWALFRRNVGTSALTQAEREDAEPSTAKRDSLPLIWAVPHDWDRSLGRFWAFFPTETETTLSGILNAPWKTNADRQNLLKGAFNERLLKEFVHIVADAWGELLDPDNPGSLLDLLPSRQRDEKNWADASLGEGLYEMLASRPSVPNGFGNLVFPGEVLLRPDESMTDGGRRWLADNPHGDGDFASRWLHPSVESRERRPRAERLGCDRGLLSQWLSDIAAPKSVSSCKRALALVDAFLPSSGGWATVAQIRSAAFVLTTHGELVVPDPQRLCLPSRALDPPDGMSLVHRSVATDPVALSALKRLDIKELGIVVQVEHEIQKAEPDWQSVWELLRKLPGDSAIGFVRSNASLLRVKTCAGTFVRGRHVLLPGAIADLADKEDHGLIVDMSFHKTDMTLLESMSVSGTPSARHDVTNEDWYADYLAAARGAYRRVEPRGSEFGVVPQQTWPAAGPLHCLARGGEQLKARFSAELLGLLPQRPTWIFHYSTRPKMFEKVPFVEPTRWCLSRYGLLPTSLGPRPASLCVSSSLSMWQRLLPVATISKQLALELAIATDLAQLTLEHWRAALELALSAVTPDQLEQSWAFYVQACAHVHKPAQIAAYENGGVVVRSPDVIHTTDDRERFSILHEAGIPALLVEDRAQVEALVGKWGLTEGVAVAHFEPSDDEEHLLDALPGLYRHVPPSVAESTLVQPCARIWVEIHGSEGLRQRDVRFARNGATLCYKDDTPADVLLERVVRELRLQLTIEDRAAALAFLDREQRQRLVEKIRAETSVHRKLLVAVGYEAIFRQLPVKVCDAAIQMAAGRPGDEAVAEAAVAVFGVEVLKRFGTELGEAGLDPPRAWNGGRRAQAFCEELGLPLEYAGFQMGRRDPMLEVDGPIELRPLHDFQRTIADTIRQFLVRAEPDRGLLSLPTGAGKTRVVVEAIIDALKKIHEPQVILWIAQTDELCEQAVQAWSQAWRAIGPAMRIRVSRLWGATNNLVRPTAEEHVVVTTYQSLKSRMTWPEYQWLKMARCVVIDEAHGSTAPAYTEILHGFGLTARESARHLIGLTATPFRGGGYDEEETRWLANRYGKNRFDHGAMPDEDPYRYLQGQGILAMVDQEVLEGQEITLSAEEQGHLAQYNVLPPTAEQRLGDDDRRNRTLISAISKFDPRWPVLFFATSVDHAHLISALLSLSGITSKAVSGSTDPGARRHYIEEFKAGRIRVLTNYGVLATGFDAPAVRALVIARPVYGRGLYQQMIGRGLRGPKNGGKERCLVVNVADNVSQFGSQLAFRDFEHLWQRWEA